MSTTSQTKLNGDLGGKNSNTKEGITDQAGGKSDPSMADYKKYVRQLKIKLNRMKDHNDKLITEISDTKTNMNQEVKKQSIDFAMKLTKKVVHIQVCFFIKEY